MCLPGSVRDQSCFVCQQGPGQGAGLAVLERRGWERRACGAGLGWVSADSTHVRSTVCSPKDIVLGQV